MNAPDHVVAQTDGYRPPAAKPPGLIRFAVAAVVLLGAFSPALYELVRFSLGDSLYSHIPLIPLVSFYFVWINRQHLPGVSRPDFSISAAFGLAGLGLLAGFWWASQSGAKMAQENFLSFMTASFVLLLIAAGGLFLGKELVRAVAFPLGFLVFMVPFPAPLHTAIETFLQYGSAAVAFVFFKISGMPVFMQDLFFQLPGFNMQVAPECSGIHSSLALLITSLVAGKLFLRSRWRRTVLAAVVIPLALVRNGFRVFTIGQLCVRISPDMINSYIHRQGGPIFFALSLIPFSIILWFLFRSERAARQSNLKAA